MLAPRAPHGEPPDDEEPNVKNDPEEEVRVEDARHVELDHRVGPDAHDDMYRPYEDAPHDDVVDDDDESDGGAVGMKDRDVPEQEGDGWSPYREPAEGDDKRGALPDR
jgi:hypothetical protein